MSFFLLFLFLLLSFDFVVFSVFLSMFSTFLGEFKVRESSFFFNSPDCKRVVELDIGLIWVEEELNRASCVSKDGLSTIRLFRPNKRRITETPRRKIKTGIRKV